MRTLLTGVVLGAALGVVGTLGIQRVRQTRDSATAARTVEVFDLVPIVMERALPGVRVLDVGLQTPATRSVSYEYQALYDAHITYQHNGRIKRVILPFGRAKDGTIFFPNTTDVVVADDKAEVIKTLGADTGTGVQPNNEMQRTRPAQAAEPRR